MNRTIGYGILSSLSRHSSSVNGLFRFWHRGLPAILGVISFTINVQPASSQRPWVIGQYGDRTKDDPLWDDPLPRQYQDMVDRTWLAEHG